jgi:hypothetical protein
MSCSYQLSQMAAMSNNVQSPTEPYPLFFSGNDCLGNQFPLYYFSIDCVNDGEFHADRNCLHINTPFQQAVTSAGTAINFPDYGPAHVVSLKFVNKLPALADSSEFSDGQSSNIFFANLPLRSWYVPPQYRFIFYTDNPNTVSFADQRGVLVQEPGTLINDACKSRIYGKGTNPPSFLNMKTENCEESTNYVGNNYQWFVIEQIKPFSDIIEDMCIRNTQVSLGGEPKSSLNIVWSPQSPACDSYMTGLCNSSSVSTSPELNEACSCFTQKKELDKKYGEKLKASVCCFGGINTKKVTDHCFFNVKSYKTHDMLKTCCSFSECQALVNNTITPVDGDTGVNCSGNFIQFPTPAAVTVTFLPNVHIDKISKIPTWVWVIFAVSATLLVAFIVMLSFLTTPSGKYAFTATKNILDKNTL